MHFCLGVESRMIMDQHAMMDLYLGLAHLARHALRGPKGAHLGACMCLDRSCERFMRTLRRARARAFRLFGPVVMVILLNGLQDEGHIAPRPNQWQSGFAVLKMWMQKQGIDEQPTSLAWVRMGYRHRIARPHIPSRIPHKATIGVTGRMRGAGLAGLGELG